MDNPQTWKQERPSWCPHTDCNHRRRAMDNACVGALPEPAPHDGDVNHYRLCLCGVLPDDEVFDLQVNDSDLHWLRWLFSALHEDPEVVRLRVDVECQNLRLRDVYSELQEARHALQWIAQQTCTMDAEFAAPDTACTETGACITEFCLSCYARVVLKSPKEKPPVCLGCGKTFAECKCTDEEIEYHKRLEREQKAE